MKVFQNNYSKIKFTANNENGDSRGPKDGKCLDFVLRLHHLKARGHVKQDVAGPYA